MYRLKEGLVFLIIAVLLTTPLFILASTTSTTNPYFNLTVSVYNDSFNQNQPSFFTFDSLTFNASFLNNTNGFQPSSPVCTLNFTGQGYALDYTGDSHNTSLAFTQSGNFSYDVTCTSNGLDITLNSSILIVDNANLSIFDDTSENVSNIIAYNGLNVSFYANYTTLTSSPIMSGSCTLNTTNTLYPMTYNGATFVYETNLSYTTPGTYEYTVTCNSSITSTLTQTNNITVIEYRPYFVDSGISLNGTYYSEALFNDFNGDGLFDIMYSGLEASTYDLLMYSSNGSSFSLNFSINNANVEQSSILSSDFDNDGNVDILVCGRMLASIVNTTLYRNDGGIFTAQETGIVDLSFCSISGSDIDDDGDIDILISGTTNHALGGRTTIVYENNGNFQFSEYQNLIGLFRTSSILEDFNNDGLKDIILIGDDGTNVHTLYYLNNGSSFSLQNDPDLINVTKGSIFPLDYNQDGFVDMIISGSTTTGRTAITTLYLNTNGDFSITQTINTDVMGLIHGADINNDMYLDFIVTNTSSALTSPSTKVYLYNETIFTSLSTGISNLVESSSIFYDYDLDGDVDALVSGFNGVSVETTLYQNNISLLKQNHPPTPPTVINATYDNTTNTLNISWNEGSDDITPDQGITYQLRVGTSGNYDSIVSGAFTISSNPATGYEGNMRNKNSITLHVPQSTYYIQVKAIDSGYLQSNWSDQMIYSPGQCFIPNYGTWTVEYDCLKTNISDINVTYITQTNNSLLEIEDSVILAQQSVTHTINGTLRLTNTTIQSPEYLWYIVQEGASMHMTDSRLYNVSILDTRGTLELEHSEITFTNNSNFRLNSTDIAIKDSTFNFNNSSIHITHNTSINNSVFTGLVAIENYAETLYLNNVTFNGNITSFNITSGMVYVQELVHIALYDDSLSALSDTIITLSNNQSTLYNATLDATTLTLYLPVYTVNVSGQTNLSHYTLTVYKYGYDPITTSFDTTSTTALVINLTENLAPDYTEFDDALTTDFEALAINGTISSVQNATVGLSNVAQITFLDTINFQSLNLSRAITLNETFVLINTTLYAQLSGNVNVTFFNTPYGQEPIIKTPTDLCSNCNTSNYSSGHYSIISSDNMYYSLHENAEINMSEILSCNVINQNYTFSFDYIDLTNNSDILNATCILDIDSTQIQINYTTLSYEYTHTFATANTYAYNITCSKTNSTHETSTYSSSVQIKASIGANNVTLDTTNSNTLIDVYYSALVAADYDNDGSKEVFITGSTSSTTYNSGYYDLVDGNLVLRGTLPRATGKGTLALFDIDNDEDLDLYLSGDSSSGVLSQVYKNNGGTFTQVSSFTNIVATTASILDYNNDGYLDLFVTGHSLGYPVRQFYKNTNGTFSIDSVTSAPVTAVNYASSIAFDYDNDGDDDLFVTGLDNSNIPQARLYKNTQGTFTQDTSSNFTGVYLGSVTTADLDNNSYMDLVVSGCYDYYSLTSGSCNTPITTIYSNHNGVFTAQSSFQNVSGGSINVFDYNNDGLFDFVGVGTTNQNLYGSTIFVYTQNNSQFEYSSLDTQGLYVSTSFVTDYDLDSDLDIFITGRNSSDVVQSSILTNDASLCTPNSPPTPPTDLNITYNNQTHQIFIEWSQATDDTSTQLYYHARLSNSTQNGSILSGAVTTISKSNPGIGNMQTRLNYTLNNQPDRCMFLEVKSQDTSYVFSNYSTRINYSRAETCDSYDNNCDQQIDEGIDLNNDGIINRTERFDQDGDGYYPVEPILINPDNSTQTQTLLCTNKVRYDCDDTNSNIHPGATEIANNGIDEDCANGDLVTSTTSSGTGGGGIISTAQLRELQTDTTTPTDSTNTDQDPDPVPEPTQETTTETTSTQTEDQKRGSSKVLQYENLASKIFSNKINHERVAYPSSDQTQIEERIKSIFIADLHNVTLRVYVPKEIEYSASNIFSNNNFTIIQEDPIIEFNYGTLEPFETESINYYIQQKLYEHDINQITLELEFDALTDEQEQAIKDQIQLTNEVIDFKRETIIKDNETEYIIDIDFKNESILYDVSVYEEIPKCLVEIINEEFIDSEFDFEIVNVDPLIVWHFDQLVKGDQIRYAIKAVAEEDCANSAESFAVAKNIFLINQKINWVNVALTFAIIPLIMGILIFFAAFSESKAHEDEEVEQLIKYAKQKYKQGVKKEQLVEAFKLKGIPDDIINQAVNLNAKNFLHHLIMKFEIGFEELILVGLIALNIFDALEILPGDFDFIKKFISWTILSYLLYEVSITRLLFGEKRKWIDISLLLIYFVMILKNFVAYAINAVSEIHVFIDFFTAVVRYNQILETSFFILGNILLIVLSLRYAYNLTPKAPSVMHVIHLDHERHYLTKFITVYMLFIFFFTTLYNLMFEWLAIAIDAPLATAFIFFYVFVLIKHKEKFSFTKSIYELSGFAEKFYHRVIDLFHYRKTIGIGISGVLILHLATELGNYIVPYLTGLKDALYFEGLGEHGHLPIFSIPDLMQLFKGNTLNMQSIFFQETLGMSALESITHLSLYVFNIIFVIFLVAIPAYIWYHMYKHRHLPINEIPLFKFSATEMALFLSSLYVYIVAPAFKVDMLGVRNIGGVEFSNVFLGVDIQTQSILLANVNPLQTLGFAAIVAVVSFIISKLIYQASRDLIIFGISATFMMYITMFFTNLANFFKITFIDALTGAFYATTYIQSATQYLLAIFIFIIFVTNIFFYIGGSITLILELALRKEIVFMEKTYEFLFGISRHHHMHHTHHYGAHNKDEHGDELAHIEQYMIKSLDQGHEMFYIVEHLVEHGWPHELIQQALNDLEHDKAHKYQLHHLHHSTKTKEEIKALQTWIKNSLKHKVHLEHLFDVLRAKGWAEADIAKACMDIKELHKEEVFQFFKLPE